MSPDNAFIDVAEDMVVEEELGDFNDLLLPN